MRKAIPRRHLASFTGELKTARRFGASPQKRRRGSSLLFFFPPEHSTTVSSEVCSFFVLREKQQQKRHFHFWKYRFASESCASTARRLTPPRATAWPRMRRYANVDNCFLPPSRKPTYNNFPLASFRVISSRDVKGPLESFLISTNSKCLEFLSVNKCDAFFTC